MARLENNGLDHFSKTLLSVPAIILFMFVLWRTITITGIAVAIITKGQRDANSQFCFMAIKATKVPGKTREAVIEANEIYRQIKTIMAHIIMVTKAQIV